MDEDEITDLDPEAAELNPEQLCFALHKGGGLLTRHGRPVWATRRQMQTMPDIAEQLIPIDGAPPLGSVPLFEANAAPDVVGRMLDLVGTLEKMTAAVAERVAMLDKVTERVAGRPTHERELLARAAELIDPDAAPPSNSYEVHLDWLSKWREVTS